MYNKSECQYNLMPAIKKGALEENLCPYGLSKNTDAQSNTYLSTLYIWCSRDCYIITGILSHWWQMKQFRITNTFLYMWRYFVNLPIWHFTMLQTSVHILLFWWMSCVRKLGNKVLPVVQMLLYIRWHKTQAISVVKLDFWNSHSGLLSQNTDWYYWLLAFWSK